MYVKRIKREKLSEATPRQTPSYPAGPIKQRVARPGEGRSGGFRTVIANRHADRATFRLGFAKNARGNIDDEELDVLQGQARAFLRLTEDLIAAAFGIGELVEIEYGDES